jgi:anti-sigma-K factor RskA
MTGTDLHQLSGAYAMDALDDVERARFEHHLAACESCRVEVASFRATVTELAGIEAVEPPPSMRSEVLARAQTTRQVSPILREAAPRLHVQRLLSVAAGFLLVAVVGLSALSAGLANRIDDLEQLAVPVSEVLRSSDTVRLAEGQTPEGGVVRVLASPTTGQAVLVTNGFATVDADLAYQVWLVDADGEPTSAGLLDLDGDGATDRVLTGAMDDVVAIGITVEPAGGSPAPTTDPVAVIEL